MYFKRLLAALLLLISSGCLAQNAITLNSQAIDRTGMEVLGGWSAINLAGDGAGWAASRGEAKYFYKMSFLVNIPNMGVALIGYFVTDKTQNNLFLPDELVKRQSKIETRYLVNAGFDAAGVGVGIYLRHRGIVNNSDKLKGYGAATIVQSVALLLFDGTMYGAQRHFGNRLRKFFEKNDLTFDGREFGIVMHI